MSRNITIAIIAVIVLVGGYFLLRGHGTSNMDMNAPAPVADIQASSTPDTASSTASVDKLTVSGGNFYFTPSALTVKKGDTVEITFTNAGGMHDFKIDEFNVATPRIASGATSVVTFVADKTGTFDYYCSVGDHRAMGMQGVLTVTD